MSRLQALHLEIAPGQRFALLHEPEGAPRALVVHVHAFAEEMNKARRMVSLQARALAAEGVAVLVPDLLGCGDSDGEFGEASWTQWVDDVTATAQWLRARHPDASELWLWGLRAGCLLAAEAAARIKQPTNLLFWQPAAAGKALLQQFLRLRMAAELQGGGKGITEALRRTLAKGRSVEIAGYALNPALACGMEAAALTPPERRARSVWLELGAEPATELLPASARAASAWQQAGWPVQRAVVTGPAFWQTTEIEEAPALIEATTRALRVGSPVGAAVNPSARPPSGAIE